MARIIYTLKIALLRHHLTDVYDEEFLEDICSLAFFLSLYYVKPWLSCQKAAESPKMDIQMIKQFQQVIKQPGKFSTRFVEFAIVGQKKLMDHLWYLSERLVPLCLFSDSTPTSEKKWF